MRAAPLIWRATHAPNFSPFKAEAPRVRGVTLNPSALPCTVAEAQICRKPVSSPGVYVISTTELPAVNARRQS